MRTFVVDGVVLDQDTYRAHLVEQFTGVAGESFLDLGCNEGYESIALARRGASRIVAVDGREHYVQTTAQKAREAGFAAIEARQADARKIDQYGWEKFDNVVCFGLLYHMSNPLNLLRRLRNLARKRLFLETHVGPLTKEGLLPKHKRCLSDAMSVISLEGEPYEGRIWLSEAPDIRQTTGSLDEQRTFWVTVPSLTRMLEKAGFKIEEMLYENIPSQYQPWANATNLGHANTKIFAVCQVINPCVTIPALDYDHERPQLQTARTETWRTGMRKISNRLKQLVGWSAFKKKLQKT